MELPRWAARRRVWLAVAATLALVLPLGWMWQSSLLPDSYDLATMGYADFGGGPGSEHGGHGGHGGQGSGTAVADLVADPERPADVEETLTVSREDDRFLVNGSSPGPTLTATVGDLVQVTLVNENVDDGVTLHWHGVDVPNAADGVAGVTQDAVGSGERFVYRFVVDQPGTFWYHSHQVSHEQVRQGLLGALVVRPATVDPAVLDDVAVLHRYGGDATVNGEPGTTAWPAEPGQQVRLRVVNTDNGLSTIWVTGAPFTVLAVDGTDLNAPQPVEGLSYGLPAGGRVDLGFTVPSGGVRVELGGASALVVGSDPTDGDGSRQPDEGLDLLSYGEPAELGLDPDDADRRFEYRIGRRPGFLDGRPGMWWTINGHLFPDVPMFMVAEGDVVVMTVENSSGETHPMHLHGHHAVVLSRDGEDASGSPWWVDSLEVNDGESYEIAFLADNPGLWMDHCHNLPHAAEGLVAHLMYTDVRSSFRVGGKVGNEPE